MTIIETFGEGPQFISQKPVPSTGEEESVIVVVTSFFVSIIMDGTKKPLPHKLNLLWMNGGPNGIRTRVTDVKVPSSFFTTYFY
jgi:hypothetical protein